MKTEVAVVLPAYNEAAGLETLLWRIARALDEANYVIVVVDDGSTDGTAGIAEALTGRLPIRVIRHERNSGYGAAIRTGLLAARELADVTVTMDADDSHDPSLIPLMLYGVACGSDVVVASRFVPGGREVGVPVHRRILSHGAAFVFARLLRVNGIRDYTSGYRAYRSSYLDELIEVLGVDDFVQESGFTVGVELLLKSDRLGGRLAEVPLVLRYDRKRSDSKLRIGKTLADYADLLKRVRNEPLSRPVRAHDPASARSVLAHGVGLTLVADLVAIFLAFAISFVAYWTIIRTGIVSSGYPVPLHYFSLASMLGVTTVVTFWRFGLYASHLSVLPLRHLQLVGEALTVSVAAFFAVLFLVNVDGSSRLLVVSAIAVAYPLLLLSRSAMTTWLRARRLRSSTVNRVLIYGAGETGRLLAKKILAAPRLGSEVVGFLDDHQPVGTVIGFRRPQPDGTGGASVLGTRLDLVRVANETGADELYVAIPDLDAGRLKALRAETDALGLELGIVPRIGSLRPDQLRVDDLGAIPVLRLHREEPRLGYTLGKRMSDLAFVFLISPLVIPLGLLTAALVAVDGRPILFRQTRIGLKGRPFTVWKFRTMYANSDPYAESPVEESDPRITRIGRLVRTAGLDELPQLINVVRGEMSLVGPRPEMPQIVAEYDDLQRQRLSVPPGISGLWQLSHDRSQAIHDNLEYDLYYLRQQRLFFDFLILGETAIFVLRTLARSMSAVARRAWTEDTIRLRRQAEDAAGEYVLLALDQRRRPDEPDSWTRCFPKVASLTRHCHVKLLVAEKNSARIHELLEANGGTVPADGLEYIRYSDRDEVNQLAGEAGVVVTDLDHLAEWAAKEGVVVLHPDGVGRSLAADSEESVSLAKRVQAVFEVLEQDLGYAS